jgi:tetratricopeptide (TPR) repeat protein
MASVRSKEGNHTEAIKILEKGIRFCPKDYNLYYQIGHQFELTDQYEPAIEAYQTALKKGRGTPIEALRNIGNIYYDKLVNSKKAKEFYKKYLKAGGKDEEVAIAMKKLEN